MGCLSGYKYRCPGVRQRAAPDGTLERLSVASPVRRCSAHIVDTSRAGNPGYPRHLEGASVEPASVPNIRDAHSRANGTVGGQSVSSTVELSRGNV